MMSKKSLAVWIPALLVSVLLTAPATAQSQLTGRYRVVDGETGEESVARLDLGRLDDKTYVLLTLFSPPETPGAPGTYKVFAGFTDVGGLRNPYVRVQEARNSYQMLKRPALMLRNPGANLKPGFSCMIELALEGLPYSCSDSAGPAQSGRMLKLLPTPPPVPFALRETVPGFYRVVDDGGGQEALARLEFKGNPDFSTYTVLTLFSPPVGPDAPGTYRMFAGLVVSQTWSFQTTVRELRNPYAQLTRPALLRTVPNESLVPDFFCSLGSPTTADIFYSCRRGADDIQSGSMIKLR